MKILRSWSPGWDHSKCGLSERVRQWRICGYRNGRPEGQHYTIKRLPQSASRHSYLLLGGQGPEVFPVLKGLNTTRLRVQGLPDELSTPEQLSWSVSVLAARNWLSSGSSEFSRSNELA
jgi:hypothetical protein